MCQDSVTGIWNLKWVRMWMYGRTSIWISDDVGGINVEGSCCRGDCIVVHVWRFLLEVFVLVTPGIMLVPSMLAIPLVSVVTGWYGSACVLLRLKREF